MPASRRGCAVAAGDLIAKVGGAGAIFFNVIFDAMLTGDFERVDPVPCLGGKTGEPPTYVASRQRMHSRRLAARPALLGVRAMQCVITQVLPRRQGGWASDDLSKPPPRWHSPPRLRQGACTGAPLPGHLSRGMHAVGPAGAPLLLRARVLFALQTICASASSPLVLPHACHRRPCAPRSAPPLSTCTPHAGQDALRRCDAGGPAIPPFVEWLSLDARPGAGYAMVPAFPFCMREAGPSELAVRTTNPAQCQATLAWPETAQEPDYYGRTFKSLYGRSCMEEST